MLIPSRSRANVSFASRTSEIVFTLLRECFQCVSSVFWSSMIFIFFFSCRHFCGSHSSVYTGYVRVAPQSFRLCVTQKRCKSSLISRRNNKHAYSLGFSGRFIIWINRQNEWESFDSMWATSFKNSCVIFFRLVPPSFQPQLWIIFSSYNPYLVLFFRFILKVWWNLMNVLWWYRGTEEDAKQGGSLGNIQLQSVASTTMFP